MVLNFKEPFHPRTPADETSDRISKRLEELKAELGSVSAENYEKYKPTLDVLLSSKLALSLGAISKMTGRNKALEWAALLNLQEAGLVKKGKFPFDDGYYIDCMSVQKVYDQFKIKREGI